MKRTATILFGLTLGALFAACAGTTDDDDGDQVADDGVEVITSASQAIEVGSLAFDPVSQSDPATAADEVVANTSGLGSPSCVTKTKDAAEPRVVHITFADCTGPYGLVHVKGEVKVTFSAGGVSLLHAEIAGVDLTANDKPIAFDATAEIAPAADGRDVAWKAHWSRTTDEGLAVDHSSELTVKGDTTAGCPSIDGSATTTVTQGDGAGRGVDSTFTAVKLCKNPDGALACPSGTVKHTGETSGASVTCAYDGSATAKVTGPAGRTWDLALACPAYDPS